MEIQPNISDIFFIYIAIEVCICIETVCQAHGGWRYFHLHVPIFDSTHVTHSIQFDKDCISFRNKELYLLVEDPFQ